jgi:hypothetical protein
MSCSLWTARCTYRSSAAGMWTAALPQHTRVWNLNLGSQRTSSRPRMKRTATMRVGAWLTKRPHVARTAARCARVPRDESTPTSRKGASAVTPAPATMASRSGSGVAS